MPRIKTVEIVAEGTPVLHTPQGASPRGLRSDAFTVRPTGAPPSPIEAREDVKEPTPDGAASDKPVSPGPRDWDFAVPDPVPERTQDPLIDPDVNWRQHAGLRAPAETVPLPDSSRERFSENWQRIAAEPVRDRHGRAPRKMERSGLTRWMFSNGRFEMGAAFGLLLLLALLVAAFVYGRRILTSHDQKTAAPGEVRPANKQ